MTLIASVTVGVGGAASIDFTSIPSTYTDLKVISSSRTNRADTSDHTLIQFNGVTTSLSGKRMGGSGAVAFSFNPTTTGPAGTSAAANSLANTFGNSEIYIPNYAGSANKSWSADGVPETNAVAAYSDMDAGLWANTAAITSIKLLPEVGTLFLQNSTAYLYGISKS